MVMRVRGVFGAIVGLGLLALCSVAAAQYGGSGMTPGSGSASKPPAAKVGANGNPFTGGLSFTPKEVTVKVGEVVQWTNTDSFAPHTATENHNLWDLGGNYGATPANPPGFAPGASVQREFSAGTFNYFCRVHPTMKGIVAAPVELSKKRFGERLRVIAVWSEIAPPDGQVFDVEKRKGKGAWKTVREGTGKLRGRFRARKGQRLSFRARVRKANDADAASDYSPVAKVKLGQAG
jgi:plastocyanin